MRILKKLITFIIILIVCVACGKSARVRLHAAENIKGTAVYGDSVKSGSTYDMGALLTAMQKQEKVDMRLKGMIHDVCTKEGCWMTMKLPDGKTMRITFNKKYHFAVPETLKGKEVVINGFAYKNPADEDTEAADNGQIAFEATGVVVL